MQLGHPLKGAPAVGYNFAAGDKGKYAQYYLYAYQQQGHFARLFKNAAGRIKPGNFYGVENDQHEYKIGQPAMYKMNSDFIINQVL